MENHGLKLTRPDEDGPEESLSLERRYDTRHHVTGRVTALLTRNDPLDQHKRITSLQLMNMSETGLGVFSQEELEPGTNITVFVPPHGPDHGMDLTGQVVRCQSRHWGYEIGVHFSERLAA